MMVIMVAMIVLYIIQPNLYIAHKLADWKYHIISSNDDYIICQFQGGIYFSTI